MEKDVDGMFDVSACCHDVLWTQVPFQPKELEKDSYMNGFEQKIAVRDDDTSSAPVSIKYEAKGIAKKGIDLE